MNHYINIIAIKVNIITIENLQEFKAELRDEIKTFVSC